MNHPQNLATRILGDTMAVVGSVEKFDFENDNWLAYVERVEQYFVANDITTEEKMKLTKAPLLCLYEKQLPIRLACDASSYGVGAVLWHVNPDNYEKPIAFASRRLNNSEMNYSQLDKGALAIIFGVGKFRQYVFGYRQSIKLHVEPECIHPSIGCVQISALDTNVG